MSTFQLLRVVEGENIYLMPHSLFPQLRVRLFDAVGIPRSPPCYGAFQTRFVRIQGRGRDAINNIQAYEHINLWEQMKIMNTFKKIFGICEKEYVFLLTHVHPVIA